MPVAPSASKTIAQILLKGVLSATGATSKNVQTTFYYRRTSIVTPPTKIALSNAFLAGPYAAFLAAANASYGNGTSNIRWFDDALDPTVTTVLAGVGAISTDRATSFNAVFMSLKTGVRGRKYQGSKHFPGLNEIDTTMDLLTGAGLARWQTLQTALATPLTDATGNTWNPCVVTLNGSVFKKNPTSITYNDITQIVMDLDIGTMRKRKVKTVLS